ncbi:MAG: PilX N-terminal domain-containing pilus assembly protein [Candidatus Electronema sp. V4]|uniref:PilX N-terminal domain-containing pilus assembly protein n=1 Tax=Candidatus Electronema sp. V4 TaxID=3454756 RepID=UPI00405542D3
MEIQRKKKRNEEGFVMVASLLILLVLTLLGIAVNRNTSTEWQIAMNDRLHKQTFYAADAATELAAEVLEQSIACRGFDENGKGMKLSGAVGCDPDNPDRPCHVFIDKDSLGFWRNYAEDGKVSLPDNSSRDIVFPAVLTGTAEDVFDENKTNSQPHANINIGGSTKLTAGSAIQMAAGYEGLAKGLGSGGATLVYDIKVQQLGRDSSESVICVKYGHVLGLENPCNY